MLHTFTKSVRGFDSRPITSINGYSVFNVLELRLEIYRLVGRFHIIRGRFYDQLYKLGLTITVYKANQFTPCTIKSNRQFPTRLYSDLPSARENAVVILRFNG